MSIGVKSSDEIFKQLTQLARSKTAFFSDIWARSKVEFGPAWLEELVDNVVRLFGTDPNQGGWESLIRGYAEFALDAMRNQKFFEANGRYRFSSLKEIQGRYYESQEHMMENYLPGMYLSHYLWPHHFKLLTFFRKRVLADLTPVPEIFFDVGIGTGMYSREVLRAFPEVRGTGFDISPYSVAFTQNLLAAFGVRDRYQFVLGDIFTSKPSWETADFLVSQEVLEHLEQPRRFVQILYRLTKPSGLAYITAAINAGHSDHIHLFRSPEEVMKMLADEGWKVLRWHAEYAYAGKPIEMTPCVAGFMCQR